MSKLEFKGCGLFRQRIAASILSCKQLRIREIRSKGGVGSSVGLQDFEANFLRLVEQLTDGKNSPFYIGVADIFI